MLFAPDVGSKAPEEFELFRLLLPRALFESRLPGREVPRESRFVVGRLRSVLSDAVGGRLLVRAGLARRDVD